MTERTSPRRPSIGAGGYVVAGLSFIPMIGVLFGLIAIIWGLVSPRRGGKLVALIGALGILTTVLLYGALFYFGFVQRGGVYDELRGQLAASQMNQLVPYVELYRQQNDRYPETLEDILPLIPPNTPVTLSDPSVVDVSAARTFFYQPAGPDHYYLRSVGADGVAFTADDILPAAMPRTGLLLERASTTIEPATDPA